MSDQQEGSAPCGCSEAGPCGFHGATDQRPTTALEDLRELQAEWIQAANQSHGPGANLVRHRANELQPIIDKFSEELAEAQTDSNNLISLLLAHQENTGEFLEDDDAQVFRDIQARRALASREGVTDSQQSPPK